MQVFQITTSTGTHEVEAVDMAEGILINPVLPDGFENTDNQHRPESHMVFWGVPFIWAHTAEDMGMDAAEWRKRWGGDFRYCVRRLDGGAWDRSTGYKMTGDLREALEEAKALLNKPTYE